MPVFLGLIREGLAFNNVIASAGESHPIQYVHCASLSAPHRERLQSLPVVKWWLKTAAFRIKLFCVLELPRV
jgi:hypothetical protein